MVVCCPFTPLKKSECSCGCGRKNWEEHRSRDWGVVLIAAYMHNVGDITWTKENAKSLPGHPLNNV